MGIPPQDHKDDRLLEEFEEELEDNEADYADEREGRLPLTDENDRLPWLESDDDYDEESVDTARVVTVAILGLLAILAVVGLAWWFSRPAPDATLVADGSTIAAPDAPFRETPVDRGGTPVEGTGDLSFEVGQGVGSESDAIAAPAATATPAAAATPAADVRPSIDTRQAGASPAGAAAAASTDGVGVQVGAYSSRASAQEGWSVLSRRYSALSGMNNRILQAEVDGATVYRLQAVASTLDAAQQLCRTLRAAGGDCQVKR